jgi:hypothetical protein
MFVATGRFRRIVHLLRGAAARPLTALFVDDSRLNIVH